MNHKGFGSKSRSCRRCPEVGVACPASLPTHVVAAADAIRSCGAIGAFCAVFMPAQPFSAALLFFPSGNEIHAFYPFVRHASDAGCLPAGRGPAGRRLLGLRFHFAQGSQRHHAVPDQHRAG
ncbi:exported hypothetical protein [Cupriavidus taiwanensis]|uniref:Uncharacterized protein n=1 Tax=Cupriavidus taiwanensis TaxID=164546 RepID=A0A375J215_9BURK|nr:exported hypothetical protein [Cupriavidus taiwanensis]